MRHTNARSQEPTESMHIEEQLERVEKKIDALIKRLEKKSLGQKTETIGPDPFPDVMALLLLPDHLRKSVMAVIETGDATAEDVAWQTGRSRAVESAYLNQLVRMGHLRKTRGKRVHFLVVDKHPSG